MSAQWLTFMPVVEYKRSLLGLRVGSQSLVGAFVSGIFPGSPRADETVSWATCLDQAPGICGWLAEIHSQELKGLSFIDAVEPH